DHDERVAIDVEDEVVAGSLDLTRVAREEPATPPDALEVQLVDAGIGLELPLERVPGLVLGDQAIEEGLGIAARHRLRIIGRLLQRQPQLDENAASAWDADP